MNHKYEYVPPTESGFEHTLNDQQRASLEEVKSQLAQTEFAKTIANDPNDRWLLKFLRASMKDFIS